MKSKQSDFEAHNVGTIWTNGQWLQYITKMVGAYNGKQFAEFKSICEQAWIGHGVTMEPEFEAEYKRSSIDHIWRNRKMFK